MQFCYKTEGKEEQAGKKMTGPDAQSQNKQHKKGPSQMMDGEGERQD